MTRFGRALLAVVTLVALWPGQVRAQVKAGPEFRVNVYSIDFQRQPDVAFDGRGRFVVAWDSYGRGQPARR